MKEFIEKLIERLDEYKTKAYVTGFTNNPYELGACHAMNDAIEIVNQLAEEYNQEHDDTDYANIELYAFWQNHQWIPCSKELPPHSDDLLLIQCSGTPKSNIVFDNAFCLASYIEEGWILEMYPEWKSAEVVAWMPLPEPYRAE